MSFLLVPGSSATKKAARIGEFLFGSVLQEENAICGVATTPFHSCYHKFCSLNPYAKNGTFRKRYIEYRCVSKRLEGYRFAQRLDYQERWCDNAAQERGGCGATGIAKPHDEQERFAGAWPPDVTAADHCSGVRAGSRPRPSPGTFFSYGSRTASGGMGTSRMPISSP